jgi:nucleoside-diphosphate-sugar epimerase
MSVLISGAGLIGAHAAKSLRDSDKEILLYDAAPNPDYIEAVVGGEHPPIVAGDVCDMPKLARTMRDYGVTTVVHTAGLIGASVLRDPYRGVEANVMGTMAAVEAARLAEVRRFVFCSSMAVYDFDSLPARARIREEAPVGPKNLYGATKLSAEVLLQQYASHNAMEIIVLRLAGVFGRGRYVSGSWMGRIVNRIVEAGLSGAEVSVETRWIGTNEFIYCKDVARAIALACDAPAGVGGAYNIGTGALHTARQLVDELERLFPSARISLIENPEEETVSYLARDQPFDVERAASGLGFRARYSLRDGLLDYAEELRQRPPLYDRLS